MLYETEYPPLGAETVTGAQLIQVGSGCNGVIPVAMLSRKSGRKSAIREW